MNATSVKVTDDQGNRLSEGIDYVIEGRTFRPLTTKTMFITWYKDTTPVPNRAQRRHPFKG